MENCNYISKNEIINLINYSYLITRYIKFCHKNTANILYFKTIYSHHCYSD